MKGTQCTAPSAPDAFVSERLAEQNRSSEVKKLSLVAGSLLGLLAQPAFAEEGVIKGVETLGACAPDAVRLCTGVLPGNARIKGQ